MTSQILVVDNLEANRDMRSRRARRLGHFAASGNDEMLRAGPLPRP